MDNMYSLTSPNSTGNKTHSSPVGSLPLQQLTLYFTNFQPWIMLISIYKALKIEQDIKHGNDLFVDGNDMSFTHLPKYVSSRQFPWKYQ